jgi:hypothetical protein
MSPVPLMPVTIILGKLRTGSWISSAMFTESSKPTMAKNASEVAAVTARNALLSLGLPNTMVREKSVLPSNIAKKPTRITSISPESSTQVSTTLALTLSPTPRRLTAATSAMNASAIPIRRLVSSGSIPKPIARLAAKALDAVDAEVMPEHITAKATMKVRKWIPKALCV